MNYNYSLLYPLHLFLYLTRHVLVHLLVFDVCVSVFFVCVFVCVCVCGVCVCVCVCVCVVCVCKHSLVAGIVSSFRRLAFFFLNRGQKCYCYYC